MRDVDLVIGLNDHIVLRMTLLDDSFQIDHEITPVLVGEFDLTFVGEVTKAAGANDGLSKINAVQL